MSARRNLLVASAVGVGMTFALSLACASGPASAAEPPFADRRVALSAREQPVGAFLQNFFGQLGISVSVSPSVGGAVNGAWNDKASKVYGDISRAFNLLTYFDGQAVYVSPAAETASRTVPASPAIARQARATLTRLGLPDAQNRVRVVDNAVVAVGSRRFLDQVEEVVRNQGVADRADPVTTLGYAARESLEYRVYYLRYAWAEDVTLNSAGRAVTVPGVASILRSVMSDSPNNGVKRTEVAMPNTVPGLRGQGLSAQGRYPGGFLGYGGLNQGPSDGFGGQQMGDQPVVGSAPAGGASEVRVQADSRLNAIIVRDTRQRLDAYEPLIRALDVEPQLLEIQATIIDIDTSRVRDLGFAFKFTDKDGRNVVSFGDTSGISADQQRGLVVSTVIRDGAEFRSRLTALEAEGAARIVSRPQVMTLSNVEAVFDSTRTFYVRLAGERDVDLFNVTAGTTLKVTPHVMRDRDQPRIRLLINIEDGALSGERVDRIPVVQRSAINTQAMIDAGQSLLLGGMITQADENARDKVPVLGDMPVVGNLFRSTKRSSSRTERLFLITPRLASTTGFAPSVVDVPPPGQPLPPVPPLAPKGKLPKGPAIAPPPPQPLPAPLPPVAMPMAAATTSAKPAQIPVKR